MRQTGPNFANVPLYLLDGEWRQLAAARMAHEMPGETLQPTALIHEDWLRLVTDKDRTRRIARIFLGPRLKQCGAFGFDARLKHSRWDRGLWFDWVFARVLLQQAKELLEAPPEAAAKVR